uniref:Uncharacterized protein n=1 Tax=Arundo donax TaxID=35708 RepID=A0A0A9CF99_ARUDO
MHGWLFSQMSQQECLFSGSNYCR